MRPHEPNDVRDHEAPTHRSGHSLFYFQQDGQRSYLRFTLLGTILLVLLILIPVIALLILFFINSRNPLPETNVNITVPETMPSSVNIPVIRVPPAPSPTKRIKQPTFSMPTPITPTPTNNANEQIAPEQTPQPLPSTSPP